MNSKVLHPKTTQNTHKLQQIPQKDVKYAVICVQSGKFYTRQNFFTRAPPVVPVTNMRYEQQQQQPLQGERPFHPICALITSGTGQDDAELSGEQGTENEESEKIGAMTRNANFSAHAVFKTQSLKQGKICTQCRDFSQPWTRPWNSCSAKMCCMLI